VCLPGYSLWYSLKAIAKPKWKPNDPERVFDVEFYAYGDDEQPAEAFILGLSERRCGPALRIRRQHRERLAAASKRRHRLETAGRTSEGLSRGPTTDLEEVAPLLCEAGRRATPLCASRRRNQECGCGFARDGLSPSG